MKIKGVEISLARVVCLALYYGVAQWLPASKYKMGGFCAISLSGVYSRAAASM